jgi:uncharacterized OB-fold protein
MKMKKKEQRLVGSKSSLCVRVEHVYPRTWSWHNKNPTKHVGLVESGQHPH